MLCELENFKIKHTKRPNSCFSNRFLLLYRVFVLVKRNRHRDIACSLFGFSSPYVRMIRRPTRCFELWLCLGNTFFSAFLLFFFTLLLHFSPLSFGKPKKKTWRYSYYSLFQSYHQFCRKCWFFYSLKSENFLLESSTQWLKIF